LMDDPWQNIEQRYPVGSTVTGRVTSLASFGAFVAVEAEIEGMIHVSDISSRRVLDPREALTEGQPIRAQVLEADSSGHRLRLGIKQLNTASEPAMAETAYLVTQSASQSSSHTELTRYSKSVFVNCPTHEMGRTVTEAIIFALTDAGLLPRLSLDQRDLFATVRECHYAIHDVAQSFQLGVFLGCKEYGSDLHRMKNMLLTTSGIEYQVHGQLAHSHGNDPVEAVRLVSTWASTISGVCVDANQVWGRYKRFLTDYSGLHRETSGSDRTESRMASFLIAASGWLQSHLLETMRKPGG